MPVTPHSFLTAGGWLIPGTSALCPPATPHPQFGGPLSLPSTHSCERYPTLRNHRPSPYPSPYTHRNNSPSKLYVEVAWWAGRPLLERDLPGSRGQDGRSPPEPTPKPASFVAREEPCPVWATVGSIAERSRRETLEVECASAIAPAFLAQHWAALGSQVCTFSEPLQSAVLGQPGTGIPGWPRPKWDSPSVVPRSAVSPPCTLSLTFCTCGVPWGGPAV